MYFRTVLSAILLVLFSSGQLFAAPVLITAENSREFRQMEGSKYGCQYDPATDEHSLGKIISGPPLAFRAMGFGRLKGKLNRKLTSLRNRLNRVSSRNAKKLRRRVRQLRGTKRDLKHFRMDCRELNPVTCATCSACPAICSAPTPGTEGSPSPPPSARATA